MRNKLLLTVCIILLTAIPAASDAKKDFIAAIECGDLETLKQLVDDGFDLNTTYIMGFLLSGMPPIDSWSAFMTAAVRGDIDLALYLIEQGAAINAQTDFGNSALHWACSEKKTAVAELLIGGGADVNLANNIGETPLYMAARSLHYEILEPLVQAGAEVMPLSTYYTPIWAASRSGGWRVVQLLLKYGAHASQEDLVAAADNSGSTRMIETLIDAGVDVQNQNGRTALEALFKKGETEGVLLLIDAGVPIQSNHIEKAFSFIRIPILRELLMHGASPGSYFSDLTHAALSGDTDRVIQFIENGEPIDQADWGGRTPLAAACAAGYPEIVEILIAAGADVNMIIDLSDDNFGESTALTLAASAGDEEISRILIDAGADPNLPGKKEYKPLHAAARDGNAAVVKLLAEAGAIADPLFSYSTTPMWYAVKRNSPEIVIALITAGADPLRGKGQDTTYMHLAAKYESNEIIEILAVAGLPTDVLDNGMIFKRDMKRTPLELISGYGYFETEEALLNN